VRADEQGSQKVEPGKRFQMGPFTESKDSDKSGGETDHGNGFVTGVNQEQEESDDTGSGSFTGKMAGSPMHRLGQLTQDFGASSQYSDAPASGASAASGAQNETEQAALDGVTQQFQQRFADSAQNKEQFHALMQKTFGDQYNFAKAETIRQQTLEGDFSWMPDVQLVDGEQLADISNTQGGAGKGAYSAEKDTVYLSRELLNSDPAEAEKILTEEVGHALDAQINTNDAKGDEGDIFSRFLHGEEILFGGRKAKNRSGFS